MAGLLEQFSKGLFGLAPTPAPNGVFGQVLDSAAQWGRGVQDKAANIQTTLADLLRNPSNALPNIPPQTLANLLQQPVTPEQKQNIASKALDFGMEFGPLATVWHGSPHLFNKFDMSKIGTGEGAQAYGHGLYFAESPQVARNYQNTLSKYGEIRFKDGSKVNVPDLPYGSPEQIAGQIWMNKPNITDAKFALSNYDPKYLGAPKEVIAAELQKFHDKGASLSGSLYKVDLPDEHIAKMLDWDKPLSQQAPEVQKAIKDYAGWAISGDPKGQEIYDAITKRFGTGVRETLDKRGQSVASSYMRDSLGIPGIRYLDGGSRAGGQGTSNFVVFDDAIPKIIGRE